MPCGQKKSVSEMIHSHIVTPPFAAIDGRTLRLNTATTKSKMRSRRPSTLRRCGCGDVTSLLKKYLPKKSRTIEETKLNQSRTGGQAGSTSVQRRLQTPRRATLVPS